MSGDYLTGFGNHFASEAVPGALPIGRNSPQHVPFGLYTEQVSGTAFTAPRTENRRSWLYRLRPTASHPPFEPYIRPGFLRSGPFDEVPPSPNRLRWDPLPIPGEPTDFIDGLITYCGNGDVAQSSGIGVHLYAIDRAMTSRAFQNADGELLIMPQQGTLAITTEFGRIDLGPLQIALIPRGVRFRLDPIDGPARGYVCENYGAAFRLPDLGPIGSNGLANPRDFETPVAAFVDHDMPCELVQKFQSRFWTTMLDHEPFDVVAWHGNLAPCRYDLTRFNTINTVSFDHPDPSIFTVLTSPGDTPGTANCDFVIFPPRWIVSEDTFRPPWFHRNVMSEFMGSSLAPMMPRPAALRPAARACTTSFQAMARIVPATNRRSRPISSPARSRIAWPSCSKVDTFSVPRAGRARRPWPNSIMTIAGRASPKRRCRTHDPFDR